MRFTIPAFQVKTLRHNVTANVKLIQRKLNGSPIYAVVYEGIAIHMGRNYAKMREAFNRYTIPHCDEVKYYTA